jgi:MFS family permease
MSTSQPKTHDAYAALRVPEFRYLLMAAAFSSLASRALAIAIGYQVYAITESAMALGLLGLVQAIPAIGLSLYGGHLADRYNRRTIVLITRAVSVVAALGFAFVSLDVQTTGLVALYAIVFVAGIARGFADPASSAFEAQVVPRELYVNASSWGGSVWEVTAIAGPLLGGLVYAAFGVTNTYLLVAILYALGWIFTALITSKPMPPIAPYESIRESIAVGVRFVYRQQVLLASMALDLFAVLFGGAVALLPIFASDILQVGPAGLGLLVAAPSVGALVSMLWATRHPPIEHAGRTLLITVGCFGVATIVFALSTTMWLSLVALAAAGMFDGVSVVIRNTTVRLLSPEYLRGRIAAVNHIFIGSSNELGAFESGVAATLFGVVPSVVLGGMATLVVVAATAVLAPQLRTLNLDPRRHPAVEQPGTP